MSTARQKPVLIRQVRLWWYALALVPILGLGYAGVTGTLPAVFAPLALFALLFWIFSFGFAIAGKLKLSRPVDRRQ